MSPDALLNVGPYRVGQRLGIGGMNEVYVATNLATPSEPVALKLLLPHLTEDDRVLQMFINEARLVAHMAHPNVVRILDVGKAGDRFYQAVELVKGVPLSALIRAMCDAGQRPEPRLVVHVARSLLAGLHHAHEHRDEDGRLLKIVHRDVSPQNLLISVTGEVKLADFGIASAYNSTQLNGRLMGKVEYLAPEQARRTVVDRRADLFSAAVTVAHFATLRSPFKRDNPADTFEAVVSDPFPDLKLLRPDLPGSLCDVLRIAAEKDPAQRFASAQAALEALPPIDDGAQADLGRQVVALCSSAVEQIDEKTHATLGLHTATTAGLGPAITEVATAAQTLETHPQPGTVLREGRARSIVAGGAVALTVALGILLTVGRSPQQSAPAAAEPAAGQPQPPAATAVTSDVEPPVAATPGLDLGSESPDQTPLHADVTLEATNAPAPQPDDEGRRRAQRKRARPAREGKGKGFLTVDAAPWALVYVGGRELGETPLATVPVEAGDLSVKLVSPETGRQITRSVSVAPGGEVFIRENMR